MPRHRAAGFFFICAVIAQIVSIASIRSYIGHLQISGGADVPEFFNSHFNVERTLSSGFSGVSDMISVHKWNESGIVFVYAPIIIGAGQGTTGTHLFMETTCDMGFVSLHYGVGCLPKQALNLTTEPRKTTDQASTVPLELLPAHKHYQALLQYHKRISSGFLTGFKNKESDPLKFRDQLVHDLEKIILWGKKYKIGLALHDTPYPMLMPEIIKLVQEHYGSKDKVYEMKPIILLSERDPIEYVERRIQSHGSYSWICRPPTGISLSIKKMNASTLEGGAFDIVGCINNELSSGNSHTMGEIFYTMLQADQVNHRQFIIDSFMNYQDTVRDAAIFSCNIFDKQNKTRSNELSPLIRKTMIKLLRQNNHELQMHELVDFVGFESFVFDAKVARGNYPDNEFILPTVPAFGLDISYSTNTMVGILIFKMQVLVS